MVEGTGLENRRGFVALREFESHFLRHQILKNRLNDGFFHIYLSVKEQVH